MEYTLFLATIKEKPERYHTSHLYLWNRRTLKDSSSHTEYRTLYTEFIFYRNRNSTPFYKMEYTLLTLVTLNTPCTHTIQYNWIEHSSISISILISKHLLQFDTSVIHIANFIIWFLYWKYLCKISSSHWRIPK